MAAENESAEAPAEEQKPVLRVITPGTSAEEVAAIVAVLSAMGGGGAPAPRPRQEWINRERAVGSTPGQFPVPGRGAWRASALPR